MDKKKVMVMKDGELVGVFMSVKSLSDAIVGLSSTRIRSILSGELTEEFKGYTFQYVNLEKINEALEVLMRWNSIKG